MFSPLFSLVLCKLGFITIVLLLAFVLARVLQIQSYHAYSCCFTSLVSFLLFLLSLVLYKLVIIKFSFVALALIVAFVSLFSSFSYVCMVSSSSWFCKSIVLGHGLLGHWNITLLWNSTCANNLITFFLCFFCFLLLFNSFFFSVLDFYSLCVIVIFLQLWGARTQFTLLSCNLHYYGAFCLCNQPRSISFHCFLYSSSSFQHFLIFLSIVCCCLLFGCLGYWDTIYFPQLQNTSFFLHKTHAIVELFL